MVTFWKIVQPVPITARLDIAIPLKPCGVLNGFTFAETGTLEENTKLMYAHTANAFSFSKRSLLPNATFRISQNKFVRNGSLSCPRISTSSSSVLQDSIFVMTSKTITSSLSIEKNQLNMTAAA